jgi:(p)ppGpp synthase/HD superfamily hydrolase
MVLSPRFDDALVFAAERHRTQLRKGTQIPYVSHLLAVASLALEHGADEDEAIAALLHDVIEDQADDGPEGFARARAEIERRFGARVADIVVGCTDGHGREKAPWRERKEQYLVHLRTASPSVVLVSMCDKLHNARCLVADLRRIQGALWSRFKPGRDGVLWYYRSLVDAYRDVYRERGEPPLLSELARTVDELCTLAARE